MQGASAKLADTDTPLRGRVRVRPTVNRTAMPEERVSVEEIRNSFAAVLEAGGAKRAVVFGSYARGEADEYSDIDLVIIKETGTPFLDRYTDFEGLFRIIPKALQVLVYTPSEFEDMRENGNPFILNVIEDGVVIYETQSQGRS